MFDIYRIHEKFVLLIHQLIFEKNWSWLHWLISLLANIEVEFPLIFDEEFRNETNHSDECIKLPDGTFGYIPSSKYIPKDTFYCEGCIYAQKSKIAEFFLGKRYSGYCYYLGRGDFSFIRPTELLWDDCKDCGKYEDVILEGDTDEQ